MPRTATVTAVTPVRLLALEREVFLAAVTGSRPSSIVLNREVNQRVEEVESFSLGVGDADANGGAAVTEPQQSPPNHPSGDTE